MNKYKAFSKVAPLLLLALLAVFILYAVFFGAEVYESVTRATGESRTLRTASRYIATKAAQAENLAVEELCGVPALVIRESWEGETYLTGIYCLDGYLMELFTSADNELLPEDGERLMPLDRFAPREADGLFTFVFEYQTDSLTLVHTASDANGGAT